jgi:hypothetical protein
MHTIFPLDEIRKVIGREVVFKQYSLSDYATIVQEEQDTVTGMALNAWNRMVYSKKPPPDKFALARYIDFPYIDPAIVEGISDIAGTPLIKDISYSKCTVSDSSLSNSDVVVARVIVAHLHPNDLIVGDVYFQNPYQVLPQVKQIPGFLRCRGFGLLATVFERIERVAVAKKCDYITLTAAHPGLVKVFGKYGFTLETNEMGQKARAMEKKVKF